MGCIGYSISEKGIFEQCIELVITHHNEYLLYIAVISVKIAKMTNEIHHITNNKTSNIMIRKLGQHFL